MYWGSWIEIYKAQVPLWRNRDIICWEDNFTGTSKTPKKANHKLLAENKISQVQKDFAAIAWFPRLLKELYTKII